MSLETAFRSALRNMIESRYTYGRMSSEEAEDMVFKEFATWLAEKYEKEAKS